MRFSTIILLLIVMFGISGLSGCNNDNATRSIDQLTHAKNWDDLNNVFDYPDAILIVYEPIHLATSHHDTYYTIYEAFETIDASVAFLKETDHPSNAPNAFKPYDLPMAIVFHDFRVYEIFEGFDAIKSWSEALERGDYMMPTTRSYEEVDHITDFEAIDDFKRVTYLYVYSVACPACIQIRNDMIALAVDEAEEGLIRFANIANTLGDPPASITGVPALLVYDENGDYVKTIVGTQVVDYLRDALE